MDGATRERALQSLGETLRGSTAHSQRSIRVSSAMVTAQPAGLRAVPQDIRIRGSPASVWDPPGDLMSVGGLVDNRVGTIDGAGGPT